MINSIPSVGLIGWRGMVGSVLMERMQSEKDFDFINPIFFTTSQAGLDAPNFSQKTGAKKLEDAKNITALKACDIIITCQGGDYTSEIHPQLRSTGWSGIWIDAASTLRMNDDAIIVLDPINLDQINIGLKNGIKNFIGGNCTVSLMLLALHGLLKENLIEWISSMTYQAASGAGAQNMRELISQMGAIYNEVEPNLKDPASSILEIERIVTLLQNSPAFPTDKFGVPLAGSLIPWIDKDLENGQSKEEWKAHVEGNKILGSRNSPVFMDGLCVRVGALRCHCQALTIKLKKEIEAKEVENILTDANPWVKVIKNTKEESISKLSPAAISGKLYIPIGRIRNLNFGKDYISAFTVGDQLLWGAAEPLRRVLRICVDG